MPESLRHLALYLSLSLLLSGCLPVGRFYQPVAGNAEAPASAVHETIVTIQSEGQNVIGTLALPQQGAAPYPVVLMLHGFTNVRDELPVAGTDEKMYERAARVLGEHGMASLRIDFRGSGDSDGAWADTTFTGQIADALAALDYLAALPVVDMERLAVLGFSQGGLVAAQIAARDARVDNVVLWSAVANAPDTYKHILSDATVAAGLASGGEPVPVTTMWGAQFELKTGFFEDLYRYDPLAALAEVDDPLLVVVGLQDTTVTPQPDYGELYLRYHDGEEAFFTVESDHVFNVLTDPGPQVFDAVVARTVTWLEDTLLPVE